MLVVLALPSDIAVNGEDEAVDGDGIVGAVGGDGSEDAAG